MSLLATRINRLINRIKILPLYCIPQHGLTALVYHLTRVEYKPWKNFLIKTFMQYFKVDMAAAIGSSEEDYPCFNAFFIRHLKPGARHLKQDEASILAPVDGAVSQIGTIDDDRLLQAKGIDYTLTRLLANDIEAVKCFQDGLFATLYLSPRDYHRIHMPVTGRLIKSIFVPGSLFPVNTFGVKNVDQIFARNERYISLFATELGLMAQIMVGAVCVGSMETVFAGQITPTKKRTIHIQAYNDENNALWLNQAEEFGHFNMGSTVILLFEKDKLSWLEDLQENKAIQVGQIIGKVAV